MRVVFKGDEGALPAVHDNSFDSNRDMIHEIRLAGDLLGTPRQTCPFHDISWVWTCLHKALAGYG